MKPEHKCSKCGVDQPWSRFQLYKSRPGGQCRGCKTAAMKEKRKRDGVPVRKQSCIEGDKKLCNRCGEMKSIEEFSASERGLGGLAAYCKPCHAEKYRNADKAVIATSKYRRVNRERHLANHRVRMFERRNKIKVASDGTVTDEFLRSLYSQEYCRYCFRYVPRDDRTADHVVALNNNGPHSANNLVMACWSCNSSKRDLMEDEFMKKGLNL